VLFVLSNAAEYTFIKGPPIGLALSETLVVTSVDAGSQVDRLGSNLSRASESASSQASSQHVLRGSRIVALDGRPISFSELTRGLRSKQTGDKIQLRMLPPESALSLTEAPPSRDWSD
jgi:S1-C subfamily serine protease